MDSKYWIMCFYSETGADGQTWADLPCISKNNPDRSLRRVPQKGVRVCEMVLTWYSRRVPNSHLPSSTRHTGREGPWAHGGPCMCYIHPSKQQLPTAREMCLSPRRRDIGISRRAAHSL